MKEHRFILRFVPKIDFGFAFGLVMSFSLFTFHAFYHVVASMVVTIEKMQLGVGHLGFGLSPFGLCISLWFSIVLSLLGFFFRLSHVSYKFM